MLNLRLLSVILNTSFMQRIVCLLSFIFSTIAAPGNSKYTNNETDLAFYNTTQQWFSAWKLVSKDIYGLKEVSPVDFVFFDEKYVYSTSAVSIKNGVPVKGNDLMNLKLNWRRALHSNSLTLPDSSVIPVNLLSFAAEIPGESKSFFVMPLPAFWKQAGVSSKELGTENLITGIFIHEFSHSQQMQNFGRKMTVYEYQLTLDVEFSDDLIQTLFSKDSTYLPYYKKEVDFFYQSVEGKILDKQLLSKGLSGFKERQSRFFNDKYKELGEIDNLFLTMEGLGQYSMFVWLTHPRGGNIKRELAIKGVRRGGKWWSQDEGFALFLILERLSPPRNWGKGMFGRETESVIDLINRNLNQRNKMK